MVKSVQAEPHLEPLFQNLVLKQAIRASIGLLIGKKAVGSRDLLFHVILTPQQVGTDAIQVHSTSTSASSTKGKKPGAATSNANVKLDMPWIQEHAEQVTRSLPGGLSILGIFIICPESGLNSAFESIKSGPGPLVLHVDSLTGKIAMKCYEGGAFKPCELKFSSSFNSLIRLSCNHSISMRLPIEALNDKNGSKAFHEVIATTAKSESERIQASIALSVSHQILPDESPVIEVLGNKPAAASGQVRNHELLLACPALPCGSINVKSTATEGIGLLSGTIRGTAFVHNRETVGKCVTDLKLDLEKSLLIRLELLIEDALSWEEEKAPELSLSEESGKKVQGSLSKRHPLLQKRAEGAQRWSGSSILFPARAELPLEVNGSALTLIDYVMKGEEMSDVAVRVKELLDLDMEESSIRLMEEREAQSQRPEAGAKSESRMDDKATSSLLPRDEIDISTKGLQPKLLLIAVLALLLALALGIFFKG